MAITPRLLQALAAVTFGCVSCAAQAHFQMLYVKETALSRADDLEFAIVFTHPFSAGPTMAMGQPRAFSHIGSHSGEQTDLRHYLRPVQWQSRGNQASACLLFSSIATTFISASIALCGSSSSRS